MNINNKYKFKRIINNNNLKKSSLYIETIILNLLKEEAESNNKKFYTKETNFYKDFYFDGYAPNGINNKDEALLFKIKYYTNIESLNYMLEDNLYYHQMEKNYLNNHIDNIKSYKNLKSIKFDKFIFIMPLDLTNEQKKAFTNKALELDSRIEFWDIKWINTLIDKHEKKFNDLISNIEEIALDTIINRNINNNKYDWKNDRDMYIKELQDNFKADRLVLMLGAGASKDAGIPNWDELCSGLLASLTKNLMEEKKLTLNEKSSKLLNEKLKKENGNSPLVQIRYISTGLKEEFKNSLKNILYANCSYNSPLITEIKNLANHQRHKLKAIINFNFDDIIEVNLDNSKIKNKSIYSESGYEEVNKLSIYHVHGYLPNKDIKNNIEEFPLVFSEEGYHKVFQEPYHWSNLVQLNKLKDSTCLLIGLSMTDPNLRRLLEIAEKKKTDDQCNHYVILKREDLIDNTQHASTKENIVLKKFNNINYGIQEEVMKELDINIIWVNDYSEICDILNKIRN